MKKLILKLLKTGVKSLIYSAELSKSVASGVERFNNVVQGTNEFINKLSIDISDLSETDKNKFKKEIDRIKETDIKKFIQQEFDKLKNKDKRL